MTLPPRHSRLTRHRLFRFACVLAVVYLFICVYFWGTQVDKILAPTDEPPISKQFEMVRIPLRLVDEKTFEPLYAYWIPAENPDTPVLLYLHGQDATRGKHLDHTERFRQLGLNVLAIDYRGFAETYGEETPREATVYEDAEAALEYLTDVMKIPSNRIFIYGHSLGGAVAIELATREEAEGTAGVIVESTFTSISEMSARRYYGLLNLLPVDFLLTERFDSLSKIDLIKRPLLIIHGTQDLKVPYKMSERLCAENKSDGGSAELCLIDGAGHENCGSKDEYKYRETLKEFFATALEQADLSNTIGATVNEASIGKSTPASQ